MVTLSARIPDKLNNSFRAIARRHNVAAQELLVAAIKKLVEAENQAVHIFENDQEIKKFSQASNARIFQKLAAEEA